MVFGLLPSQPLKPVRGPRGRRRDIQPEPTYYERCLNFIVPCVMRIVGTGPSVFSKSPQEHILEARLARKSLPYHMRHLFNSKATPPGHVRVRLFRSRELTGLPEIEAILPLEPSGEFDLGRVKLLWGLDTCTAVDPIRWRLFQPSKSDIISPLAVHTLLEHYNAINIIEPSVSESTRIKRTVRRHARPYILTAQAWHSSSVLYLRSRTPVMDHFDEIQRISRILEWRVERWLAETEELTRMIYAVFIVAVLVYVALVLQGFIGFDVGFRRYARNLTGYSS